MFFFLFSTAVAVVPLDKFRRAPRLLRPIARRLSPRASSRASWYTVDFHSRPDANSLRSHGITITARSYISPTRHYLYLTGRQAKFLVDEGLAILGVVEDKVKDDHKSIESSEFLILETTPTFDPSRFSEPLRRQSSSLYTLQTTNLENSAAKFATDPDVLAVHPGARVMYCNRLSSGFTQSQTRVLNANGGFDRVFSDHGLNGSGVIITMLDSYLDVNSTFFYDPDVEVLNDTYLPTHRRIAINVRDLNHTGTRGEHGTMTTGVAAGVALCTNCTAAEFNGVAVGSRIAFVELGADPDLFIGKFNNTIL
jgi:subtilisin family serine protease